MGKHERLFTLEHPAVGTGLLPSEPSISEEYFELEREKIFKKVWLNVGRINEIPKPGDYFTTDLETIGASIIVTHAQDGVVRAFYNICRHRGNKLNRNCSGSAKALGCGFHGWTYDLKGDLIHVPDEENFFDFNKADFGLVPLATDVWEGFIFVNADPNPRQSLKEFMSTMESSLKGYPFSDMEIDAEYSITVDCNWKVFSDAFQEAYHVGYVHKSSFPDQFTYPDNPFTHMSHFRLHGYHNVATVAGNPGHNASPVEALVRQLGTSKYGAAAAGVNDIAPGINPGGLPNYMFDLHNVFPNFAMHLGVGFYYAYNFIPLSVNKTRWVMRLYGFPSRNAGEALGKEYTKVLLRDAVKEDINTTENTQRSLQSGVLDGLPLCDQELLVRHKYKVVADFIESSEMPRAEAY